MTTAPCATEGTSVPSARVALLSLDDQSMPLATVSPDAFLGPGDPAYVSWETWVVELARTYIARGISADDAGDTQIVVSIQVESWPWEPGAMP